MNTHACSIKFLVECIDSGFFWFNDIIASKYIVFKTYK